MEYIKAIFASFPMFQLSVVLAGALFFVMCGLRILKEDLAHSFLYFGLSLLFLIFHGYLLANLPEKVVLLQHVSLRLWLITVFAPVLILLILALSLVNLLGGRKVIAGLKILMGLSLVGILYKFGHSWSIDLRCLLAVLWSGLWIKMELMTAR